MSFLTVPFTRLKNTSDADDNNYETTEMTHIVNLDSFMTQMDGRTILDNHSEDESDDDNSSLSTDNSEIMNPNDQSVPNKHGVKYNYNEDEEEDDDDDFNINDRDEAEISLVRNDLENGTRTLKKVQLYLLASSFCCEIFHFQPERYNSFI